MSGAGNVFVGLGSNLSGPARQLRTALGHLETSPGIELVAVSSLYRSLPLGGIEQPEFMNAVASLKSELSPREVLDALQAIEGAMGRDRSVRRWGPRNIDLDLLVHGDSIVEDDGLSVPHPGIGSRNFVLLPLRELDPDLVVPGLGRVAEQPVPTEPSIEKVGDRHWHENA